MTFFGGRTIFGHDHEFRWSAAMDELFFLSRSSCHVGMAGGSPA